MSRFVEFVSGEQDHKTTDKKYIDRKERWSINIDHIVSVYEMTETNRYCIIATINSEVYMVKGTYPTIMAKLT